MLLDLPMSHEETLSRMKTWGIECGTFFDIGAARGSFGERVRDVWPEAGIVYFEAAPYWRTRLEHMKAQLGGEVRIEIAAVGQADSTLHFRFDETNPMGGGLVEKAGSNTQAVPVRALDRYIGEHNLATPFVLKLDVHGAEKAILEGATKFMSQCSLIIFETYNFGPAHRRFGQMAVMLEEKFGFRCIDMAEPKWRPYDKALWQIDFYFAPAEGSKLAEWRLQ